MATKKTAAILRNAREPNMTEVLHLRIGLKTYRALKTQADADRRTLAQVVRMVLEDATGTGPQ